MFPAPVAAAAAAAAAGQSLLPLQEVTFESYLRSLCLVLGAEAEEVEHELWRRTGSRCMARCLDCACWLTG